MITIDDRDVSHRLYQELQTKCPNLFKSAHSIKYITNPTQISDYEKSTGERIGVLYQMNDYEVFVVDLIEKNGKLSLHGRIILPKNGVIIVPKIGDKFILEDQYRYPICAKHLAFPRGHCELDSAPDQDAIRETREELGGAELTNLQYIGKTYPESHSDAWYCSVYEGEVKGISIENDVIEHDGYEGIENLVLLSATEIDAKIKSGEIDCGYTLAAWALYKAYHS